MVIVSSYDYPNENEELYKEYFEKFKYSLHNFQKWSLQGIIEGNHVLVTAPTGSGKSLPAEFAVDYFHSKGKKTIYCSPIKALSNQKFYDFSKKYPHISIGLITGDIKTNPNADCLIMTTEILLNKLYQIKSLGSVSCGSSISFDMDIENELGCVIFDEIHMINDEHRGHVWEQSILMLPESVQMLGLSATLDNPERFAHWMETRGKNSVSSSKIVLLTSKKKRAVPLTHYSFITANQGIFKIIKDKEIQKEITNTINKPFVIQSSDGEFNQVNYSKITKTLKLLDKNDIRVTRAHVLNQVSKYLTENDMTPAICYVFSRKQLEISAKEITTSLFELDSKVPFTVRDECEKIIRKLPNYEEYLYLPEYLKMVSLLEKGIAMHHAGLLPVIREIVEILFDKGYIKLLFATETVSIGLNLPVKTTIFTDIKKFDGLNNRLLLGHEYTQAAGRAGRLGIDKAGHVIHLNNLFRDVDSIGYKNMLQGKAQRLISKFKFSFNLLLSLIEIGNNPRKVIEFAGFSMVKEEIDEQLSVLKRKIDICNDDINTCNIKTKTPEEKVNEYLDLCLRKLSTVNKKRKDIDKQIRQIEDEYKSINSDKLIVKKYKDKLEELVFLLSDYENVSHYIDNNVLNILNVLETDGFITKENELNNYTLTLKGAIANNLRETHCLVFSKLIENNKFDCLNVKQLIAVFSCFTNINVNENLKESFPSSDDKNVENMIISINNMYEDYGKIELKNYLNTGTDYNIHYDIMNYVMKWCDCKTGEDCKLFLQVLEKEKGIFLGEFSKALLKINNISCELEKVAELTGNIDLLSKLIEIPNMTLKYVVTNQSLYV
jgi:superfamily II RNA helicase